MGRISHPKLQPGRSAVTQSEHILFVLMVCAYMFVCGCDIPSLFTGRWRIFRFAMYASVTISIIKIAENAVETLFTANFNQLQDIDHLGGLDHVLVPFDRARCRHDRTSLERSTPPERNVIVPAYEPRRVSRRGGVAVYIH